MLWEDPHTETAFASNLAVLGTVPLSLSWHLYVQTEIMLGFGIPSLHHVFS